MNLAKFNSMTKYPSIPTYHALNPSNGCLTEDIIQFQDTIYATEKIDGTNSRIIILPYGTYFIGSRNELLCFCNDMLYNPSQGIVDALRETAERIVYEKPHQSLTVYYFETYGIHTKAYSKRAVSVRLFDIATFTVQEATRLFSEDIERISSWRESGGQTYLPLPTLQEEATSLKLPLVPSLFQCEPSELPTDRREMLEFMKEKLPNTQAAIDKTATGTPEGIVLRSTDRQTIAKARFEDYRKTERKTGF